MFLEYYSVESIKLIEHEITKPQLTMDIGLLFCGLLKCPMRLVITQ